MVLWATILVLHGATLAGSIPSGGSPENITIMFLSPSEVRVSWTTSADPVEKYDVMYKPTDASYRVVVVVAGNSDSVTLTGLKPNTQYQVVVTAVRAGRKYKSRPVVFLTQEMPKAPPETTVQITGGPPAKVHQIPPDPNMTPPYIQVRGVEIGIVIMVLMVWVGAIILFFNRWGKIRMLLPYQPDYKDTQLKVPGTCQQGSACQNPGSSGLCCTQNNGNTEVRIEDRNIPTPDDTQYFGISSSNERLNPLISTKTSSAKNNDFDIARQRNPPKAVDDTKPLDQECRAAARKARTRTRAGGGGGGGGGTTGAPAGPSPATGTPRPTQGTATAGSLFSTAPSPERYGREDWSGRRLLMSRARINSAVYIGVEAEPLFPGGGRRTRSADQLVLPLLSVSTAGDEKPTEQHL